MLLPVLLGDDVPSEVLLLYEAFGNASDILADVYEEVIEDSFEEITKFYSSIY